jgi:outer membrane protease
MRYKPGTLSLCIAVLFVSLLMPGVVDAEPAAKKVSLTSEFTISPLVGIFAGQAEEIVYGDSSMDKLSQLLWDLKPLWYAGFDAAWNGRFSKHKGIIVELNCKFGIPEMTGKMQDRDWQYGYKSEDPSYYGPTSKYSYDFPYPTSWDPSRLTNYSEHNVRLQKAALVDLKIGFSFISDKNFFFNTFLAYDYMYFYWKAMGGDLLYLDTLTAGDFPTHYSPSVAMVAFKMKWHVLSPGITIGGNFLNRFSSFFTLKLSPLLLCDTEDHHLTRNEAPYGANGVTFHDFLFFGLFFDTEFNFTWQPTRLFSLGLSCSYRLIKFARGNETTTTDTGTVDNGYTAGAGLNLFSASLLFTFTLPLNRKTAQQQAQQ